MGSTEQASTMDKGTLSAPQLALLKGPGLRLQCSMQCRQPNAGEQACMLSLDCWTCKAITGSRHQMEPDQIYRVGSLTMHPKVGGICVM